MILLGVRYRREIKPMRWSRHASLRAVPFSQHRLRPVGGSLARPHRD